MPGNQMQEREGDETMPNRVLIVDDSMLMRKMVGDSLADDGWEVVGEASNGEQAVEEYCRLKPDAVTMDIVMPGTDGLYALEHIMLFDPDAKMVVVSALNQTKLISEAIRKGAQDFIAKPFLARTTPADDAFLRGRAGLNRQSRAVRAHSRAQIEPIIAAVVGKGDLPAAVCISCWISEQIMNPCNGLHDKGRFPGILLNGVDSSL